MGHSKNIYADKFKIMTICYKVGLFKTNGIKFDYSIF